MTQPSSTAPAPSGSSSSAVPSERVRLARLAEQAARGVPGVVGGLEGRVRLWVTVDRGERIPGVVVAAVGEGRHAVTLHLIARPVPLHPLGDSVRAAVETAADVAGLATALGPVDVAFEDLAEEPGAAATTPAAAVAS